MRRFLRKVSHDNRVRVTLLLAVGTALLAAPSAGAGGQAGYSCPSSFEGVTLAQDLNLPRHQAGLAAGVFTEDFLIAEFNGLDRNGDGVICAKDVGALNGGVVFWQYAYNLVDDNASVPTG